MDQLKEQLSGVIKYGFWIMCGVCAIGSLGIAFYSSSNLVSERDSRISELEQAKSSIQNIQSSISTHPNDATAAEMDALLATLTDDVLASWTEQYSIQEKLLVWPTRELGQDFVDAFDKFEPIELTTEYPMLNEVQ